MIVLAGTADVVRVTRSSANAVHVHATFVDHTTSNYTPGRQNSVFASAATGTIIAAPAASTQRSVKFICIQCQGGANVITVDYFDGATQFVLADVSLAADDTLTYTDTDGWRVTDAAGQLRTVAAGGGGGGGDGIPLVSAATGSNSSVSSLVFSNISGISFSLSTAAGGATVRASKLQDLGIVSHVGGNVVSSVTQLAVSNASGVTWSLSTAANAATILASVIDQSLGLVSHVGGNQVSSVSRLAFSNASNVTWSLSTAANAATVIASVAAGGGADASIGVVSHVGGNVVSSVSQLAFSNASNVTFSLSTAANAATVIASVAAGGGGGGITLSGFDPYREALRSARTIPASNTMQMNFSPVVFNDQVQFDRIVLPVLFSLTTSTHSGTYHFRFGIYTRNVSSLSLLHSTSFSTAITVSTGNTSLFQGPGYMTAPWTSTITAGQYWLGAAAGSTSAGANASLSVFMSSQLNSSVSRLFGQASAGSVQDPLGLGQHSVSSGAVPGSVAFSAIIGATSQFKNPTVFYFQSQTA
jgi:hypothetical protein